MQNVMINGKPELCFLIKDGEAAKIVIPVQSLAAVDYRRLTAIEAKGGEMMAQMRDTRLDNGMNALTQYQSLLVTVKKDAPKPKAEPKAESDDSDEEEAPKPKAKRRGGRSASKSEGISTQ